MKDQCECRMVLLHSNDIHSHLEQAAQMASYIEEERAKCGTDRLLVLDIGDHMDRMRVETEGSYGAVNIELLNAAGYDAITLGNNEGLTYTIDTLSAAYQELAKFKVLCANMLDKETGKVPDWLLERDIIEKNGLRLGVIGITAPFAEFYTLLGWEVTDPVEAVRKQASLLREHVDVLIVMSHVGLRFDEALAAEVDGIDLILGAHTHHLLLEPIVIGSTTICAAGKFGEHMGRVEIGIDPMTSRPCFHATCVPMAAYAKHPQAADIIGGYLKAGERRLSRVIARLDAPLPASAERESPLGNLLAAGLRRWTDAEIGIVNAGQLLGGLAAGDVTEGVLHALCPSPINPCRMQIAGKHIRAALEQSLLPEYIEKPMKGYGFRGKILGTLAVDGIEIELSCDAPVLERIRAVTVGGRPLEDERLYTVGTIDMFTFRAGYLSLSLGNELRFYMPEFIRDVIAHELQNSAAIEQASIWRWNKVADN